MTAAATTTAAAHSHLPGYRADRASWTVYADTRAALAAKGPRYSLQACGCGAQYLRAHGCAGRPREYCSDVCKNLRPALNQFAALVDAYAERCAEHGGDDALLRLKRELLGLTQLGPMQAATGRRGQAALRAKRAAAAAK